MIRAAGVSRQASAVESKATAQAGTPAVVIGRSPGCLVRVDDPAVPAHWLELRWQGNGWAWRTLNAEERTRGAGAFLYDAWRALEVTAERGTRVALGNDAWVEIVDAGPPEPFAWDVLADHPLEGHALEEVADGTPLHASTSR